MEFVIDILNQPMDYTAAEFATHQAKEQLINVCSSALHGCVMLPLEPYLESLRGVK